MNNVQLLKANEILTKILLLQPANIMVLFKDGLSLNINRLSELQQKLFILTH